MWFLMLHRPIIPMLGGKSVSRKGMSGDQYVDSDPPVNIVTWKYNNFRQKMAFQCD